RISRIQDSIEPRSRHLLLGTVILDLAVAEPSIITPVAVKQLVAFRSESGQIGVAGVVEGAITKFKQTCAAAARDDLIEWVERIERVRLHRSRVFASVVQHAGISFPNKTRRVRRGHTGQWHVRRNGDRDLARSEERPGSTRRQ